MSLIPAGTVVVVETKWFPPLRVELSESGGKPGIVVRVLKPKVSVLLQGRTLVSAAPGGEPVPYQWNKVKIGLAVASALVLFGLLRLIGK